MEIPPKAEDLAAARRQGNDPELKSPRSWLVKQLRFQQHTLLASLPEVSSFRLEAPVEVKALFFFRFSL